VRPKDLKLLAQEKSEGERLLKVISSLPRVQRGKEN
jgi:hypothetical protein